jgi:hypothetical protein
MGGGLGKRGRQICEATNPLDIIGVLILCDVPYVVKVHRPCTSIGEWAAACYKTYGNRIETIEANDPVAKLLQIG